MRRPRLEGPRETHALNSQCAAMGRQRRQEMILASGAEGEGGWGRSKQIKLGGGETLGGGREEAERDGRRGVLYDSEKTGGCRRASIYHVPPSVCIRPAANSGGETGGGGGRPVGEDGRWRRNRQWWRTGGGGRRVVVVEDREPFIPPFSSSWLKLY